ncbi:hypothetical protein [Williamwhitmania taraxaci]|uniref:Uncharacterized protein n=1 Tax=Williamwhitmania taraxaci TaxID=1640674 RepID=A0A1G6MAC6_9BACT|nr:hypothetical protein [Williamwhitmania taraxaci]SDC52234.1 hypothetical protein SAMN05216323_103511 [Williamwhitmania taraxaci]
MSKVYEVDFKRLVVLLLPTFLRKPLLYALLKAMARPVVSTHTAFMAARRQALYKANHTGQVCYLRGCLNDAFDAEQRRLYISDAESLGWCILYKKETFPPEGKGKPIILTVGAKQSKTLVFADGKGARFVSKQGSVGAVGADFAVMVPMALRGRIDESRIVSLVNFYKLASKRYMIQYF